jgi:pimeloyl-ACP methyl ester carboxylesterase
MKFVFTILLLHLMACHTMLAQRTKINGSIVERVYRDQSDSSANFYLVLQPKEKVVGLILFLPGYGSFPRAILYGSDLPSMARKRGYIVVIPYLGKETFYIDSAARENLRTLVPEILAKYGVSPRRFVLGGHSAGGNAALLYAAEAFRDSTNRYRKPAAAFGIDPPLDMARFRNTVMHEITIGYRRDNIQGMTRFLAFLDNLHGGSPTESRFRYESTSAYSRSAEGGGNTKFLASLPVRLYCDPDVHWSLENLGVGYEHLNASDLSACIAQLRMLGNTRAELMVNLGKGYFGKSRHPHALNQLNSKDFLKWVDSLLNHSGD